jgi:effector-binding domain-containing protein
MVRIAGRPWVLILELLSLQRLVELSMVRLPGVLVAGALLAFPAAALAQSPPAPGTTPSTPAPVAPGSEKPAPTTPASPTEAFAQEVTLSEKTIIYFKGTGNWDAAFDTIVDGFKTVKAYMDKADIKPAGPATTIYTATDDTSFSFQAAFPIAEAPKDPPKGDIAIGKSPAGKALKFVHRGSYDSMDTTYEAITNYLDEKQLDAKDMFIEEYETDPVTTPEDKLVIDVYVPLR